MRRDDIDSLDTPRSDGDDLIFLDETLPTVGGADDAQPIGCSPSGSSDGQEGGELYARWRRMADEARENMGIARRNLGILIEVAAQHPLHGGTKPGIEFRSRLDMAVERYYREREIEQQVKIYVPGSRRDGDEISLSAAGSRYLEDNGIPISDIYGDGANEQIMGECGVFNSTDECAVAASLFWQLGYGRIVSYCSPEQILRKALSYIEFGIIPEMQSVYVDAPWHDYVDEAIRLIPPLLNGERSPSNAKRK